MRDARSDLPDLSVDDLATVYDLLQQMDAAVVAAINVPNMKGRARLAVFLDNWLEAVAWQKQDVADAIRRNGPTNDHQRRERARILFDYSLRCDDEEAKRFTVAVNEALPPMRAGA